LFEIAYTSWQGTLFLSTSTVSRSAGRFTKYQHFIIVVPSQQNRQEVISNDQDTPLLTLNHINSPSTQRLISGRVTQQHVLPSLNRHPYNRPPDQLS
jgi:hypothetical protein